MDSIVTIPQRIVDWLNIQPELSDVTFFTEFPPILKSVPLKKAIVAVGIEEMSIVDKFVANDEGVLEKQEYCRTANIKTRLSICVPYSYGGSACHDYFTKIIDALTFRTDLNIEESGCSEIESDRDTSALVCHGWFKIVADFCPAESIDENFTSFLSKDFICSSHITNDEIHVTNQDKELWNNPVVTGFYTGTGQSTTSVTLDFVPKFLMVFCTDFPVASADFSKSLSASHMAVASGDFSSAGLSLTSTGFKITRSTINGTISYLNELGYSYCYVAFK
ncbi:MAG: hypothetical protein IJZ88_00970 [Clostridia bacterium]|nr:hypothetical protein [Clostridia bacterium]